ncbi:MAG: UDP-N-acetyl-D-glucosamine 6-dehydrogenase [Syntrophomonadaceae bacterium]|nr:UDP-N-acetyl-D-glucosamine 6-dehydrogenase [Bacillota bacterium]MBT9147712.1 UDP-N-acetyl-D-glucosamine 6-dehydrogenase [Bacillota bacterium]
MVFQMSASQIQESLITGKIKIAVIGLGQVGLPLALHFAKEGASVIGADIDKQKVDIIKQGDCPINTNPLVEIFNQVQVSNSLQVTSNIGEAIRNSSIHVLCVPTPLGSDKLPDLRAVIAASEAVGKGLKKGDLVILESSVYPGVTTKIVKPILEKSSRLKAGEDFGLAYCFERIDPGNSEHRLDNTPKIIGAVDEESADGASAIYGLIVKAPIIKVADCETAEMVKLVENVYRDINIAFANELALLCQKLNIDALEVLSAASTKWNFIPHVPGAGVGGMCIPVNPYYLLECARGIGFDLKLVQQAREINESMPHHIVDLVKEALARIGKPIQETKMCILGLAYKADVDDTRGTPAEGIASELEQLGARVVCYDPLVTTVSQSINFTSSLEEAVKDSDCIIIATDHSSFKSLDLQTIAKLAHTPLAIVDGRHVLIPREVEALGITYVGLGRSQSSDLNIWNSGLKAKGK